MPSTRRRSVALLRRAPNPSGHDPPTRRTSAPYRPPWCKHTNHIATEWSPEQAVAVFEILDELRERVWERYGPQIQQIMHEQQCTAENPPLSNVDDADVPF